MLGKVERSDAVVMLRLAAQIRASLLRLQHRLLLPVSLVVAEEIKCVSV